MSDPQGTLISCGGKLMERGSSGGLSWSRLSEQNFRVDKWSFCPG